MSSNQQKSAAMLKVNSLMKQGILSPAIKGLNPSSLQSALLNNSNTTTSSSSSNTTSSQSHSAFGTPVKSSHSNGLFSEAEPGVVSAAAFMSSSSSPIKETNGSSFQKENSTPNINSEKSAASTSDKNWMKSKRLKQFAENLKEMDGVESLVKQSEELQGKKKKKKI